MPSGNMFLLVIISRSWRTSLIVLEGENNEVFYIAVHDVCGGC